MRVTMASTRYGHVRLPEGRYNPLDEIQGIAVEMH